MTFSGGTSKASTVNGANSGSTSSTYTQEARFRTKAPGSLMGMVNKTGYRNELRSDRELYVEAGGRLAMARCSPDVGTRIADGGRRGPSRTGSASTGTWTSPRRATPPSPSRT